MNTLKLNRSDYTIIGGYLLVVTVFLILKFQVENYSLIEYLIDIPVFWIQCLALLIIAKALIENFLIRDRKYVKLIVLGFFSLWFISFLVMLSGQITQHGFVDWAKLPPFGELLIQNINSSIFNLCIPLSLLAAKKYYEFQLEQVKFADAQKEVELRMLRSQFDPHFLYNNLNTIDALIDYSPKEKVKEYIANLAALYRHLASMKEVEIVALEEEISLARNYLYLIETRFEEDYVVSFRLGDIAEGKYLPSGALLSLLENIVKHNKPEDGKRIAVEIKLTEEGICVKNSKPAHSSITENSLGTGLSNLRKRYELLSDKQMHIMDTAGEFEVCLPLLTVIN